jgi:hypothetical protein
LVSGCAKIEAGKSCGLKTQQLVTSAKNIFNGSIKNKKRQKKPQMKLIVFLIHAIFCPVVAQIT